MSSIESALVRAVLFLLRRYAKTGWVPNGDPMHRDDPHDSRDCECEACVLASALEQEAR